MNIARFPAGTRRLGIAAAFAVTVIGGALLVPAVAQAAPAAAVAFAPTESDPDQTTSTSAPPSSSTSTPPDDTPPSSTPPDDTPPSSTPPDDTPPSSTPPDDTPSTSTPPDDTPSTSTPPDDTPSTSTPPDDTPPSSTSSTSTSYTPALGVFDPGPCVGAYVTAEGSGFAPDEQVTLTRDGVLIATVTTDANGAFDTRVDLPGVDFGTHEVVALGLTSGARVSGVYETQAQVCTSGSTTVPTTTGAVIVLASTGFPTGLLLGTAALVMFAGVLLLVAARRRQELGATGRSTGPQHR